MTPPERRVDAVAARHETDDEVPGIRVIVGAPDAVCRLEAETHGAGMTDEITPHVETNRCACSEAPRN